MRGMKAAFALAGAALEPSDEQLLEIAQRVACKPAADVVLARLLRRTAAAAAVVLACAAAAGAYLGHRAKAAAHEALVLDRAAATLLQSPASSAGGPGADAGTDGQQQARFAQWIVDDLAAGRRETRR